MTFPVSILLAWFFPLYSEAFIFQNAYIISLEGLFLSVCLSLHIIAFLLYSIAVVWSRINDIKWFLRKKVTYPFLLSFWSSCQRTLKMLQLAGWVWAEGEREEVLEGGSSQVNLCLPCLLPGIDRLAAPAKTLREGSGRLGCKNCLPWVFTHQAKMN